MAKYIVTSKDEDGKVLAWKGERMEEGNDSRWTENWIYAIDFRYEESAESASEKFGFTEVMSLGDFRKLKGDV